MNIIKSPQDNIDAYLYNEINIQLYNEVCTNDTKEKLTFFNLLFKEFEFFCENINNYTAIVNHFENFQEHEIFKVFKDDECRITYTWEFFDFLERLIDDKYPREKRTGVIVKTSEYIEKTSINWCNQFQSEFDYERLNNIYRLKQFIELLSNEEKLLKLVEYKHLYLEYPLNFEKSKIPFDVSCDLEIQKINELIKYENPQREHPEAIDLSETTATEKIIYLHKLGIIDFLRNKQPFQSSTNSLATVLSAITGINPETKHIQSMLNPIINKEAGQKNNPLNSQKTVLKIETQLINIGFNLNETN